MAKKSQQDLEDAELLEQVFHDVTPLPGRVIKRNVQTPAPPKISGSSRVRATHAYSAPKEANDHLPEINHEHAPGLDKRSAKKLKRGLKEIEARLARLSREHVAYTQGKQFRN